MANCPLCGHKIPDRKCMTCGKVISQNLKQLYCPDCARDRQRLSFRHYWYRKGKAKRIARRAGGK